MSVTSPCNSICKMDENTGLCMGCWRTIDEIIAWGSRSDDVKKEILALIKLRKDLPGNTSTSISKFNTVDKTT
jgi:uncharacterized protein